MNQAEVFESVVKIISPYANDQEILGRVDLQTNILDDLKVNSARLVDVVLEFEDVFGIEIEDEDIEAVETVGDAVSMISRRLP